MGGLAAWIGFTLPSAVLMVLAAALLSSQPSWLGDGWVQGLLVAPFSPFLATRRGSDLDDPRYFDSGSRIQCSEFPLVGSRVCGLDALGKY